MSYLISGQVLKGERREGAERSIKIIINITDGGEDRSMDV